MTYHDEQAVEFARPDFENGRGKECGEGATSTGQATVWAGPSGEKPNPVAIPERGVAVFEPPDGSFALRASFGKGLAEYSVWQLHDGELHLVRGWKERDGNRVTEVGDPPDCLEAATDAVWARAEAYHTRDLFYCEEVKRSRR